MSRTRFLVLAFAASVALHLALGLWPAEEGRRAEPGVPVLARLAPPPDRAPPRAKPPAPSKARSPRPVAPPVPARDAPPARARFPSTIVLPAGGEVGEDIEAERLSARQRRVPRSDSLPTPASPVDEIRPRYPAAALAQGIKGHVLLEAIVGIGGEAQEVVIIDDQGAPQLAQAAVEAVRRARFVPARDANGITPSRLVLRVEFTYE